MYDRYTPLEMHGRETIFQRRPSMNILVIGNGFDLAHGLPTSYSDFLNFCKTIRTNYTANTDKHIDEIYTYINHNTWLDYFLDCPSYVGENWIDFESEIARVIRSLDNARSLTMNGGSVLDVRDEAGVMLTAIMKAAKTTLQTAFKDLTAIDKFSHFLYEELERLIRALEIYIAEFVDKSLVRKQSPDIACLHPDHVLSFNYSNTYERLYGEGKEIEYDYLHGEADINNTLETNNMVLGIDEYLADDVKNQKTEFIEFKKYYQRMYKQSKRLAEVWCSDIRKEAECEKNSKNFMREKQIEYDLMKRGSVYHYNWEDYERLSPIYDKHYDEMHPKHNVYIFGHSLDVTDKDILRNLILNDNVHTTVFYCKKKDKNGNYDNGRKDYGQKLTNLVKVIGQEELIKRTGGGTKTIEFKLQQDMMEG